MCSEKYSQTMLRDHLVFSNLFSFTVLIVLAVRFNSTSFHMEIARDNFSH